MNYKDISKTDKLEDVIDEIKAVEDQLENLGEKHYILYRQVVEAMEDQGATIARTDTHVAKLTPKVSYDPSILAKLREITDPEDLDGVYTPEHEEIRMVPERWNMTKGRKLLKLGNDHQAIIEDAKIFGNPSLKVFVKGDNSSG